MHTLSGRKQNIELGTHDDASFSELVDSHSPLQGKIFLRSYRLQLCLFTKKRVSVRSLPIEWLLPVPIRCLTCALHFCSHFVEIQKVLAVGLYTFLYPRCYTWMMIQCLLVWLICTPFHSYIRPCTRSSRSLQDFSAGTRIPLRLSHNSIVV